MNESGGRPSGRPPGRGTDVSVILWLGAFRSRLNRLIDSDEVRLFQAIVYFGMMVSGVYMLVYGAPTTVQKELGGVLHGVWVALAIIGPGLVAIGDWMVHSGKRQVLTEPGPGGGGRIYWGWYLQMGGDTSTTMVYATYVTAAFQSAWLQRGIFAAFIFTSLMICAGFLVYRDYRRIRAIERT